MIKPYYQRKGVTLYLGDCLEIAESLPHYDAVVSDPPYGINYVRSSNSGKGKHNRRNFAQPLHGDDVDFDPTFWIGRHKLLLWGTEYFRRQLPKGGTLIAWDKRASKDGQVKGPDDDFPDCEFAWTSENVKRNVCRYLWKGIACVKDGEEGGRRYHPTQKPVGLMQWCLKTLGLGIGSTVLDPYCGSGSTGVACVRLGIKFIGIEIKEDYLKCAVDRLQRELVDVIPDDDDFVPKQVL